MAKARLAQPLAAPDLQPASDAAEVRAKTERYLEDGYPNPEALTIREYMQELTPAKAFV